VFETPYVSACNLQVHVAWVPTRHVGRASLDERSLTQAWQHIHGSAGQPWQELSFVCTHEALVHQGDSHVLSGHAKASLLRQLAGHPFGFPRVAGSYQEPHRRHHHHTTALHDSKGISAGATGVDRAILALEGGVAGGNSAPQSEPLSDSQLSDSDSDSQLSDSDSDSDSQLETEPEPEPTPTPKPEPEPESELETLPVDTSNLDPVLEDDHEQFHRVAASDTTDLGGSGMQAVVADAVYLHPTFRPSLSTLVSRVAKILIVDFNQNCCGRTTFQAELHLPAQ
jgi:hypothetical protein